MKHRWRSALLRHSHAEEASLDLSMAGITGIEVISSTEVRAYYDPQVLAEHDFATQAATYGFEVEESVDILEENWSAHNEELHRPITIGAVTLQPVLPPLRGVREPAVPSQPLPTGHTLEIVPGLGFGTGHHPATRLLVALLQHPHVVAATPELVLDAGTGSGILALVTALLHQSRVLGIDNDPLAIANASQNLLLNQRLAQNVSFELRSLEKQRGSFDMVTANIYAEVLCAHHRQLAELLRPGGLLLLSGILAEREHDIIATFGGERWLLRERREEEHWHAFLIERRIE